jgi:hypothetical protein
MNADLIKRSLRTIIHAFEHGILAAFLGVTLAAVAFPADAASNIEVKVGFIRAPHIQETVSILDIPAADDGIAGANLATEDNNTTGGFLGQTYSIEDIKQRGRRPGCRAEWLIAHGISFVLADLRRRRRNSPMPRRQRVPFSTPALEDWCGRKIAAPMFSVAPAYSMPPTVFRISRVEAMETWLLIKDRIRKTGFTPRRSAIPRAPAPRSSRSRFEDTAAPPLNQAASRRKGLFLATQTRRPRSCRRRRAGLCNFFPPAHDAPGRRLCRARADELGWNS